MKTECKICKKNYNILTIENLCYYCFVNKYKVAPSKKQYGNHDK